MRGGQAAGVGGCMAGAGGGGRDPGLHRSHPDGRMASGGKEASEWLSSEPLILP